jgi:hypothetical protein
MSSSKNEKPPTAVGDQGLKLGLKQVQRGKAADRQRGVWVNHQ